MKCNFPILRAKRAGIVPATGWVVTSRRHAGQQRLVELIWGYFGTPGAPPASIFVHFEVAEAGRQVVWEKGRLYWSGLNRLDRAAVLNALVLSQVFK